MNEIDWASLTKLETADGEVVKVLNKSTGVLLWEKPQYIPFTPPDEETFPTTLYGFYAETLEGNASGSSSSYIGSVFAKPWLSQDAKKLGKIYSSIGNGVSSFSYYKQGSLAIGYSSDSAERGNKALNVWCFDYKPTAAEANEWINQQHSTILYELFTDDGSVWKAKQRTADGKYGYLNESTNTFVEVKDMDAMPSNDLLMGSNPRGEEGD